MEFTRARLAPLILLVAGLGLPHTARAQVADDTTAANSASKISQEFWLSLGLGRGSLSGVETEIAWVFRANLSSGALLMTYRGSDLGGLEGGAGVRDDALLVGARTTNHRAFAAAAIGLASARPYFECDCTEGKTQKPQAFGFAYDATVHANVRVVGVGFSMSGVAGPARVSYLTLTTSLEFGWFGP